MAFIYHDKQYFGLKSGKISQCVLGDWAVLGQITLKVLNLCGRGGIIFHQE